MGLVAKINGYLSPLDKDNYDNFMLNSSSQRIQLVATRWNQCFLSQLYSVEDIFLIDDDVWDQAKRGFRLYFRTVVNWEGVWFFDAEQPQFIFGRKAPMTVRCHDKGTIQAFNDQFHCLLTERECCNRDKDHIARTLLWEEENKWMIVFIAMIIRLNFLHHNWHIKLFKHLVFWH